MVLKLRDYIQSLEKWAKLEKKQSEKKSQKYQFEGQNEKRCWKRRLRRSEESLVSSEKKK